MNTAHAMKLELDPQPADELRLGANEAAIGLIDDQARNVLDLGSTDGSTARGLQRRGCHVVAVAPDRAVCSALRRHCASVIHADARAFRIEQMLRWRRFDAIVLGTLLQRMETPTKLLSRSRRLLRNDGQLVATFDNVAHGSRRLALLRGTFDAELGFDGGERALRHFTLELIERTLGEAGFGIVEVERLRYDRFRCPETGRWWPVDELPQAVRLLIEQDEEADVARYVVLARPDEQASAQVAVPAESQQPQLLLAPQVKAMLEREQREALEQAERAKREALERAANLERVALEQAEQLKRETLEQTASVRRESERAIAQALTIRRDSEQAVERARKQAREQAQSGAQALLRSEEQRQAALVEAERLERQLENRDAALAALKGRFPRPQGGCGADPRRAAAERRGWANPSAGAHRARRAAAARVRRARPSAGRADERQPGADRAAA